MRIRTGLTLLGAVATAAMLTAGQPQAQTDQQQALSEQDVRTFLAKVEQEATQAMTSGEYGRLMDWTRNNLADEATFSANTEVYVGDQRKSFSAVTLEKKDMLRLGNVMVAIISGMSGKAGKAVEDYSLEIAVADVTPVGPNAAMVATRITESGTLKLSAEGKSAAAGEQGGDGQGGQTQQQDGQQANARAVELEATADCKHLIRRDATGDRMVIGITTCNTRMQLG